MTDEVFDYIRKLLLDRSAIALEPGKQYLVESRLGPVLRQAGLPSLNELVVQLRTQPGNGMAERVVEALVTTETSFFRDHAPFEALRKTVLPELVRKRAAERALNVWCAACSTGQEPYSLALLIREHFPELLTWQISITATDLSRDVLARAREGLYNQIEANRGLPAALLVKYFQQHGTHWQLDPTVRNMVTFRELNLARPWPYLPRMDLIFLRNVMIYFDVPVKKEILGRVARLVRPDGYLLLGAAETTFGLDDSFRRVGDLKAGFHQLTG